MSPRNIDSSLSVATVEPLFAVRPAPAKPEAPSFDSHLQRATDRPARRGDASPSKPAKNTTDKRPASHEATDNKPADHTPEADSAKPSDPPKEKPGEEAVSAVSEQAQSQPAEQAADDEKETSPSEENQVAAPIATGDAAAAEQALAAASLAVVTPVALAPQVADEKLAGETDPDPPTKASEVASKEPALPAKQTGRKEKSKLPSATLPAAGPAATPDVSETVAETEPAVPQVAASEAQTPSTTEVPEAADPNAAEPAAETSVVKVSELHATQTHLNVAAVAPQPSAKVAPEADRQSSRGESKRDAKKPNHSKAPEPGDGKAKSSVSAARRATADETSTAAVNAAAVTAAAVQSASSLAAIDKPADAQSTETSAPKPHEPSPQAASAIDSQTPRQPLADAAPNAPARTASGANHAAGRAERGPVASESDRNRFVNRVAKAFQTASERGGPLRLRLSPPELGSLKMEVSIRDGALTARLEAETPEARAVLLDNLPALRERLAEQHIKVERFDVELQSQTSGEPGGHHLPDTAADRDSRQGANRGNRPKDTQPAGSAPVSPRSARRLGDDGQLNVVI